MSPLMIVLLILIMSIRSSLSSEVKKYKLESDVSYLVKNYVNSTFLGLYTGFNGTKNNQIFPSTKGKKLRQDLHNLMSTMVKKIIQQRRSKGAKKWQVRENREKTSLEKMAVKSKVSIGEYPVDNNLERGREERRDGDDYNAVIGQSRGGIRQTIFRNPLELSETLVRENVPCGLNKVQPNFARIKPRVNRGNESTIETKRRDKRAGETDAWIKKDFKDHEESFKMHALVVRDEDIPPCCSPAKEVTNRRYFMCSGAVLTLKHALTTASCMHFADIYGHNIDADLGILVGATSPRAYVIKINRYEMHPNYDYEIDSKNHPTNNVALIYLECSIVPRNIVVPSLPKGINDDVAHMCCREGCDIITIEQASDNRHTARVIKARYLPAPRHDAEVPTYHDFLNSPAQIPRSIIKQLALNETSVPARIIRSPFKLAAAPIFFGKEPRGTSSNRKSGKSVKSSATRKRKKTQRLKTSWEKQRAGKKNGPFSLVDLVDGRKSEDDHVPILRALEEGEVDVEEQLAAVDWEKIEETMSKKFSDENREVMEVFAKNVVDETMKRLDTVLGDEETDDESSKNETSKGDRKGEGSLGEGSDDKIFSKLMAGDKKNKTIGSFVKVFTKVVTSLVPPNSAASIAVSSDSSIEEKDLEDAPPIYVDCPPLGAPVITDGVLVGFVAYTCDDVQNWVEWKYVNLARNIIWIRKKIIEPYEPVGKCSETEKSSPQARSLPEVGGNVSFDKNSWMRNQMESRESRVEWTGREIANERREDFPRNFEDARIPMTETSLGILKDSWFARNSRLAPRERSDGSIYENSRNQPKISVLRNVPVYKVNTCYVKPDGTTDCETRTEYNLR